jgi:Mn2+/Fe2+ NRAMP family transporter
VVVLIFGSRVSDGAKTGETGEVDGVLGWVVTAGFSGTGFSVVAGAGAVITGPNAQEVAPIKNVVTRNVTNRASPFFIVFLLFTG